MRKRGLFSDKRGIVEEVQLMLYLLAGIAVAFVFLEVGKLVGSGDFLRSQALTKDVALTVDSLISVPYPTTVIYQSKGFKSHMTLQVSGGEVTLNEQGRPTSLYYFVPDLAVPVQESETDILPDQTSLIQLSRNARSIAFNSELTQEKLCTGSVLPISNPIITVIVPDQNLKSTIANFFGASAQSFKFESDDSSLDSIKPNFVIVVRKEGSDPHTSISFKSRNLSDSRRIACIIANGMTGVFNQPIQIIPGSDAILDKITYPGALVVFPDGTEASKMADSLKNIPNALKT